MSISYSSDPLFYYFVVAFLLLFAMLVSLTTSTFMQLARKKEHIVHKNMLSNVEIELETARKKIKEVGRRNVYLERENLRLNRYAVMPDAFAEVKQQRDKAQKTLLKSTQQANLLLNQAKNDADSLISQSRKQLIEKNEVADLALRQARERADSIVADAESRAEQVAGDAWEAKDRLVFYQRTALAMKNKVRGYGDEYLVPSDTLIADLSDNYQHEQAAKQLKCVCEQIKIMIRDGLAADCDYKADLRRERSIAFVLDAFNGKAESILATVNTENFGTMQARLKDAFELVNYNGRSFKNARILPKYADLYQAQLKYVMQVKELKRRDEEEQRRLKANMSEQRRTQNELKKVKRQTKKELKRIPKAIKKTQAKLENCTDAQWHQYQAQLAELMGQLGNAEAIRQKTELMTQSNKNGYVYVISNIGSFGENVLKIGMTRRLEPADKIEELGDASVPFGFDVHAIVYSDDAPKLERYLHEKFRVKRINKINSGKGFFDVALGEVRAEIEALNLNCQWTMKADALEYRESAQLSNIMDKENAEFAELLEIG